MTMAPMNCDGGGLRIDDTAGRKDAEQVRDADLTGIHVDATRRTAPRRGSNSRLPLFEPIVFDNSSA